MHKYNIIGNQYYCITNDRKVLRKDGLPLDLMETEKTITLSIYGFNREVEKEWLYWVAYFKLEMPDNFKDRIFDIEFKEYFSLQHMRIDPKMVIFKTPVYIDHDKHFRMIARFPNYGINYLGNVINIKTNKISKHILESNDYPTSTIIDQANLYTRHRQMSHRLVAMTWVQNDNYEKYYLVDHIDGNKSNCHYTNLRWTDHRGNNKAKIHQGLSTQAYKVDIRDIDTNDVKSFNSLTDACRYMKRSPIDTKTTPLKPERFFITPKGRFEIKYTDDKREWYYLDKELPRHNNQRIEIIIEENGIKNTIRSFLDFKNKYFKNRPQPVNIKEAIKLYKEIYNNDKITINIFNNDNNDSYIAYNTLTGVTIKTNSRFELSLKTGIHKSSIQKSIANNGSYQFNNWVFKVDDMQPFSNIINLNKKNKPFVITVEDITSNIKKDFDSLRQAANYLNIDKKTIKKFLNTKNLLYKKYLFFTTESIITEML